MAASARSRWRRSTSDRSSAQCRSSSTRSTGAAAPAASSSAVAASSVRSRSTSGSAGAGSATPGTRAVSSGSSGIRSLARVPELDAQLVDRARGGIRAERLRKWLRGGGKAVVATAV